MIYTEVRWVRQRWWDEMHHMGTPVTFSSLISSSTCSPFPRTRCTPAPNSPKLCTYRRFVPIYPRQRDMEKTVSATSVIKDQRKTVVPWNAGPCWLANSLLGERSCNPAFHWRTKLPWLVVASNRSRCGWCTSVASSHHTPWAESQSTAVCPATTVPEFNCSDVTLDWNCLYPVIFKDTLYKTAFFFLPIHLHKHTFKPNLHLFLTWYSNNSTPLNT